MKTMKVLFASFMLLVSLCCNAQGIKVYLKDGTLLDYEITDISQVNVITLSDGTKGFAVLDENGNSVEYPLSILQGFRCEDNTGFYYGHKVVDLGLPSGTLWAEYNIGASKPEQFGNYYFWGAQSDINTSPWPYYHHTFNLYEKYRTDRTGLDKMDMFIELLPEDDIAHLKWGDEWCMPTMGQKHELLANTTHTRETLNGVEGWRFTSKINDNSIFFPAAGVYQQGAYYRIGEQTCIWTSTVVRSDNNYAYVMCDRINDTALDGAGFDLDWMSSSFNLNMVRNRAMPVRAVMGHAIDKLPYLVSASPNDVEKISPVSAQMLSFVHPKGASDVKSGVCYSLTQAEPTMENSDFVYGAIIGEKCFSDIKKLTPNKEYFVRYFVTVNGTTTYSLPSTFTTTDIADMVTTGNIVSSTTTSAVVRSGFNLTTALYDNVEKWVCYSTASDPTINDTKAEANGKSASCTASLTGLIAGTTYHYRACIKIDGQVFYGEDKTFVAEEFGTPDYVDLGLPSGLKWATMNLGATAPEEIGDYYAWAETTPRTEFTYANYLYQNGTYANDHMQNYNGTDRLRNLKPEHDAATVNLGAGWRMPTSDEAQELIENSTIEYTILNGIECNKVTGPNGNCIYIPYAGYKYYDTDSSGSLTKRAYIWTSSLRFQYYNSSNHNYELALTANFDPVSSSDKRIIQYRGYGLNIRAVHE